LLLALSVTSVLSQELFEGTSEQVAPEIERMYVKGLQFLVRTQTPQGAWAEAQGSQPAVVALAVLSLLAHGEDVNTGPYSKPIRLGLEFILSQQQKDTGYIGTTMYNHGFGTLALAEAYGMVRDPRLGPALRDAVKLILQSQAQNPFGAWRYSPQSKDADTTVSGAQMVALFAARNAGLGVPQEAIEKGMTFYRQCQSGDGGFGYTGPGGSNLPRTAIGALMFIMNKQKDSPQCKLAVQFLKTGQFQESYYYHYYLYYVSQVYFHLTGDAWETWNRMNVKLLQSTQRADGGWDGAQGQTFSTACSLLSLALNYRYLPIYER
jgi:prenyltransferase beta subunit